MKASVDAVEKEEEKQHKTVTWCKIAKNVQTLNSDITATPQAFLILSTHNREETQHRILLFILNKPRRLQVIKKNCL